LKTRLLFIVTALLEVGIGLALLLSPALAVAIMIGAPFETKADSVVGRVGGAALLALGQRLPPDNPELEEALTLFKSLDVPIPDLFQPMKPL